MARMLRKSTPVWDVGHCGTCCSQHRLQRERKLARRAEERAWRRDAEQDRHPTVAD